MKRYAWMFGVVAGFFTAVAVNAEVKVTVDHNPPGQTSPAFKFKNVPSPSKTDAASKAKFSIADGTQDPRGAGLEKLNDGNLPAEEDQPEENFYFDAGTEGGRLQVDLGSATTIQQVNTYSWHSNTRAPQFYKLYASDGSGTNFNARPKKGTDPLKTGWTLVASVDTRPKTGEEGGQYGVSISDTAGALGNYRYLLIEATRTEDSDDWGNTFFSEIDVVAQTAGQSAAAENVDEPYVVKTSDGSCTISVDTSAAPELREWARTKLSPVLVEWYPKIDAMLSSEGYTSPRQFTVRIGPGNGVAATSGTRVTANSAWLKNEVNREGVGALLHEEVHVIQQYGATRRNNPDAKPAPGWITEGIPDYIRWFLYEPQSHGADDVWLKRQNFARLSYDGSYRITANFLNYLVGKYDKNLIAKLNVVARQNKYTKDIWKESCGKTLEELGAEWKHDLAKKLGITTPPNANSSTNASATVR